MKRYIILLLSFMMFGCDSFLDVVPDNLATIEMTFNTRAGAEKFLSTCYSYVPEHANPQENFALVASDEIWYYGEKDYYMDNQTSLRLAKGFQNAIDPYCNYWEGRRGGTNMFVAIRDCNIFLENLTNIPGLNKDEQERWLAEAKVLKAYFHFWLMRMYGPIPIIDKNLPVDVAPELTQLKREPVDKVVKYIVGLLDEAIESKAMFSNIKYILLDYGRLTASAAKAIKAEVLVNAASPLFNGNTDFASLVNSDGEVLFNQQYDENKWVLAKEACFDAIQEAESVGHALYAFNDLLPIAEVSDEVKHELTIRATITDRFNEELIWGLGNNWSRDLQKWCQPRFTSEHAAEFSDTRKSHAPTLNMVEDFYTNHGVPINEDKEWDYVNRYSTVKLADDLADDHKYFIQNGYTTAKMHTYREPRFYASVGFDGGKWFSLEAEDGENIPYLNAKAGQLSGKAGLEIYSITGYFTKKLVNYKNVITRNQKTVEDYPFPILRLSDLYLMYAEALNETKSVPDAEVYEYLQRVRTKAGLDKGSDLVETWAKYSTNPEKPKTKEGLREIIQQERMIELAFEGKRYWDIRRWKLAEEKFNKPIRGWNIFAAETDGFYQVKNIYFRDFLTKDYLWPISQNELLKNKNLVQNTGW